MNRSFTAIAVLVLLAGSSVAASAASLDDVMARLDSLQRDNQAMRKEIALLRQREPARAAASTSSYEPATGRVPRNVATAMAADLPPAQAYTKAPVLDGPYNWSGVYAGANAGYGFGHEDSGFNIPPGPGGPFTDVTRSNYEGFLGGAQIGFNYQTGPVVFGLEADLQYADIGSMQRLVNTGFISVTNKLDAFGTVRGRIGYAFDRFLPYITGGFAAGRNTINLVGLTTSASVYDASINKGWTYGAGLEYGLRNGWSVKAEYLHVELGQGNYFSGVTGSQVYFTKPQFDIGRFGVNYRF